LQTPDFWGFAPQIWARFAHYAIFYVISDDSQPASSKSTVHGQRE
jgi:hypothetical protein